MSMLPPATRWEKRAQMISFAAYNVLLDKPEGTDPWPYVLGAAKVHDERSGPWCDGLKAVNVKVHHATLKRRILAKIEVSRRKHAKS
jgi:hypothetical protein